MNRPTGWRRPEWVAAALGAVAWIAFRVHTGIVLEDALITFRFAENLATGRGFAFNPGEPVLGTTTPAFTLLLAGSKRNQALPRQTRALLSTTTWKHRMLNCAFVRAHQ